MVKMNNIIPESLKKKENKIIRQMVSHTLAISTTSLIFIFFILLFCLDVRGANVTLPKSKTPEQGKDEERIKITTWRFQSVDARVADLRSVDFRAMTRDIGSLMGPPDSSTNMARERDVEIAKEVFKRYPFEQVEALLKKMKSEGVSDVNSNRLAEARREMIRQAMEATLAEIDPGKELKIGMLDSGNKNSGIGSDIDQTIFIWPKDKARSAGIDEAKVIETFNKKFQTLFDVDPGRLGIESMNGADFYPDWRQQHTIGAFVAEALQKNEKILKPIVQRVN